MAKTKKAAKKAAKKPTKKPTKPTKPPVKKAEHTGDVLSRSSQPNQKIK